MREKHFVYIIELDKDVLYESKFKKANPEYVTGKPCVYVGMTGLDPDTRFDQHKAGIKANKYAKKYGLRLKPEIYEKLRIAISMDNMLCVKSLDGHLHGFPPGK